MLSEKLRYHVYWAFDALKGKPVKRHLSEITKIMENPDAVLPDQDFPLFL